MKVLHNPKCSKSRQALEILDKNKVKYKVIEYLKETPSAESLEDWFNVLGMEMLRQKEESFKPYKGEEKTAGEWAQIMHENPKLIERPIIIKNAREIILARPTDRIFDIIE